MDLTSKQRAQLRSLANSIDTIVHVGKDGLGENLVKQADDALEARELIKGKVLENSMLTAREAAEELAAATRSEVVQVIGTKFVLYRPSHKKDKKDKIVLVKDSRKKPVVCSTAMRVAFAHTSATVGSSQRCMAANAPRCSR